jgi:hypothetical protein
MFSMHLLRSTFTQTLPSPSSQENIAAFDITLDAETLQAIDKIHLDRRNTNVTD